MKNQYSLALIVICGMLASCTPQQNPAQQVELQKKIFKEAVKYTDFPVARTALYNIIALSPKDSVYVDSLFYFYANTRSFPQAVFLGNDLIAKDPNDTTVRELLAISKQAVGLLKESLEDYEILFNKTQKPTYLYQMASLQYTMKRVEECSRSINQLLGLPGIETEKVEIQYGQNQAQMVPIKAAAFNILGVLARDVNQDETAVSAFQKAIEVFPDFELAKGNLQVIREGSKPRTK